MIVLLVYALNIVSHILQRELGLKEVSITAHGPSLLIVSGISIENHEQIHNFLAEQDEVDWIEPRLNYLLGDLKWQC